MSDKRDALTGQIEQGSRAELALKTNEEFFKEIREQCWETFCSSDPHDIEGREACHYYMRVAQDFEARLRTRIVQGKNAHDELVRMSRENIKVV